MRLAFETSSSKKITHQSFSFSLFLFSFSGNCPRHAGVEEEKKLEVEERMNLLTILRSMRISSQFLGNPLSTCWRANANNTRIHDFGHFSRGILRVAIFRCTFEEKLTQKDNALKRRFTWIPTSSLPVERRMKGTGRWKNVALLLGERKKEITATALFTSQR